MMKNKTKKGFISSVAVYSFFVVFIMLLIVVLLTYINKRRLLIKLKPENLEFEYPSVCEGKTLRECLLISYYVGELGGDLSDADELTKVITAIKKQTVDLSSSDSGLYPATDESSTTSYFYRGDITNNYVSFAGFTWRIVRINGTDNIRIILDDVDDEETKSTLTNKKEETYSEKRGLTTCSNYYKYQSGSLVTNFNNNSSHTICMNTDEKHNVGLMYGQSSINKDERYGNINNSTILEVLYNFYDTYLTKYSDYISDNDYYCANKNPISDEDKDSSAEFDEIVNEICKKSGWEWACSNNFADALSYVNYKQIYYEELLNLMSYINSGSSANASYLCQESGATANKDCHRATNLSTYSNISTDKIKYAYSIDQINGNWKEVISSPCGYIYNGKYVARSGYDYMINLINSGSAINESNSNYSSIVGNGNLSRPIGLISATEAYLSGASFNGSESTSTSSISSDTFNTYWTGSAAQSDLTTSASQEGKNYGIDNGLYYRDVYEWAGNYYFAVDESNNLEFAVGYILTDYGQSYTPYARPVINLKSDVVYCSGDGTKDDPYTIALNKNSCSN